MERASKHRGSGLMDVLVGLVLVGTLFVLTLPALQGAREQARANSCSDNLKTLVLALQNYHDTYKVFPAGAVHTGKAGGNERMGPAWWYGVLPFLDDARHRFDKIQATQRPGVTSVPFNAQGISAAVGPELLADFKPTWMRCPASPLPVMEQAAGPIALPSYVGIAGGCDLREDSPDYQAAPGTAPGLVGPKTQRSYNNRAKGSAPHGGIMTSSGMLPPCQWLGIAYCTDGTSNTMIVGEQGDWLRDTDASQSTKYHGDAGWDTQGTAGTGPSDGGGFLSGTVTSVPVPKVNPPGAAAAKWDGDCYNVTTVRYRLGRKQVLGKRPLPGCSEDHGANNPLQSAHPGGAFVAATDGAVHSVSASIDLSVLLRLAIRDDGQNLSELPAAVPERTVPDAPFEKPGAAPALGQVPESGALLEAIQQVRLYPRDAYWQYVALQLARRENRLDQVQAILGSRRMAGPRPGAGRAESVDLFTLFSGALAVQESLQLDTMLGNERRRDRAGWSLPAAEGDERIAMDALPGPTIKSHPWQEMLGDRKPEISPLARCVPADFYFVEFRSLAKLLDLADHGDLWGTHLFSQSQREARSQLVGQRLKQQLALETSGLLRPFYDAVVEDVALAGSDLFLREGSDVTVLFRFRQAPVFRAQMELLFDKAQKSQAGARRSQGECLGVRYEHVTSPDRAVHVFAAYPEANLHVRSNSLVALERVLAAIRGQDAQGQAVMRLGDTTEFAYIRTLLPRGAAEEDGFIYLSDPFIRRLVGPQVKLTERRRMLCYNHLRMIGHASLLYRTERGQVPASLADLATAKCSPGEFGKNPLTCPDGGRYELSPDGSGGRCSHHGRPQCLTPCCEIPLTQVTGREAQAYGQFLEEYNQYWRTFFDPIAIRIQVAPQRYRIETIVLPLIDNSIYTGLARLLGGQPESLDSLPVPKRNIFTVAARLNKAEVARQFGLQSLLTVDGADAASAAQQEAGVVAKKLLGLGLAWHNYHDTYKCFPPAGADAVGKPAGLSWRVHILPFIDRALHAKFRLDEPWDSTHNRRLIAEMPEMYRSSNQQLAAAGKTRFVIPRGEQTIGPNEPRRIRFADIADGSANTIMLLETDDEHAVVWTKPDDLEVDLQKPAAGLAVRPPGGFLVAFADGYVKFLRSTIAADKLAALFTRAGGEAPGPAPEDQFALQIAPERRRVFGLPEDSLKQLRIGEVLAKGIGNRVGLHVYDSDPVFDFSLPNFLGLSLGSFQGGRGGPFGNETLLIGLLISALNSPVYVSVPVQDAKVVDEFLVRLDQLLAGLVRRERWGEIPLLAIDGDYYQIPLGTSAARSLGFQLGPIKWRFFWARIGDGLYVASQPYILEDLAAMEKGEAAQSDAARDDVGHGLVRIRPQHWSRVLPNYQLGWAENNRQACLNNIGPLSSLARAFQPATAGKSADAVHAGLVKLGERFCDTRFFCPDGAQYQLAPDGKSVTCSLHGTALAPRQQSAPAANSELGRLLRSFADLMLTLTFLEDGLHAVATIERQPSER